MKFLSVFVLFAAFATQAFAGEGVSQVAASRQAKQQFVANIQQAIALHQTLSRDEIVADMMARLDAQSKALAQAGKAIDGLVNAKESLASLDKEQILALEQARLQEVMSSTNYIFAISYSCVGDLFWIPGAAGICVFPFILDIALLPVELIMSIATGF